MTIPSETTQPENAELDAYDEEDPESLVDPSEVAIEETIDDTDDVQLPRGEALTDDELQSLQLQRLTTTVLLIGSPGTGKSTLISAVYDSVSTPLLERFRFSGSDTLVGFESICHEARARSLRHRPDTGRTLPGSRAFLHLGIRTADDRQVDLVFPDLSGEEFTDLVTTNRSAAYEYVLPFCDQISFILDGGQLVAPAQRQIAIQQVRTAARVLDEQGLVPSGVHQGLVVAKLDLLESAESKLIDWAMEQLAELAAQIGAPAASLWLTAARPEDRSDPVGLDAVLSAWCRRRLRRNVDSPAAMPARAYDRFAE